MKVLVGMPAYKLGDVVQRTIEGMRYTPASVLVVDNASTPDVKQVLDGYSGHIDRITNDRNVGCNWAWNQILSHGLRHGYDLIGLNTDVYLHPGWYDALLRNQQANPRDVVIVNTGKPDTPDHWFSTSGTPCTFWPREIAEAVYPIPPTLIHWFGDTYMLVKARNLGWNTRVIGSVRGDHHWSQITSRTPEVGPIIAADKAEWRRLYPHIAFE